MVVQHNLTAMNSNRMLGITTGTQAKSTEKLSSGYKINRAADDAAGLSISEKMRKQIRGLTQASLNAEDGISAVQTAEGALTEVHDMLQRMNELAVKAANGTMSENDRSYIQNEIDQLVTEIDRVSTTTKFNETYLLKGDTAGKVDDDGETATFVNDKVEVTLDANAEVAAQDIVLGTVKVSETVDSDEDATGTVSANGLSGALLDALNGSDDGTIEVKRAADEDTWTIGDAGTEYTANELKAMGLTVTAGAADTAQTLTLSKEFVATENKDLPRGVSATNTVAEADIADIKIGEEVKATIKVDDDGVATIEDYDPNYLPKALTLSLHVGADSTSDNKIAVDINAMSAKGLGLLDEDGKLLVDGADDTNANKAIDTIAAAIQQVSTQRSALGAVQNRLEHTIANLDNVVENTTAAESQIRDTDMATEMVKYSNNNILAQAGQAMLAQANQANQGVLSLLG